MLQVVFQQTFANLPIHGIHAGGKDSNQHLAGFGDRTGRLFVAQNFGPAIRVNSDRSHRLHWFVLQIGTILCSVQSPAH